MSKSPTPSQKQHILKTLMEAQAFGKFLGGCGGWVLLNDILSDRKIAQYNARILELRENGFDIKQAYFDKVSYYRLKTPRAMIDLDNLKIVNKKQTALPL